MSGRISDRDIAAIREGARIEDVVGDYVQLRRAGADSLKGLCPFHNEKSPSFHVRPNHGHFHCFGCGEGGDVYAFIQKIEHVSFVEAVELLADRIGHTISYTGAATSAPSSDRHSSVGSGSDISNMCAILVAATDSTTVRVTGRLRSPAGCAAANDGSNSAPAITFDHSR